MAVQGLPNSPADRFRRAKPLLAVAFLFLLCVTCSCCYVAIQFNLPQ